MVSQELSATGVSGRPLEVIIKKDNSLALRDHARGGKESRVTRDELVSILKGREGEFADQPVVISADKSVRYEEVIAVMDVLRQQQIKKVGLLAREFSIETGELTPKLSVKRRVVEQKYQAQIDRLYAAGGSS